MKASDKVALLSHLQAALDSPAGIAIEYLDEPSVRIARAHFYALRKEHPEFGALSFLQVGAQLWVIKRLVDDPLAAD